MSTANLTQSLITRSMPPYTYVEYVDPIGVDASTSSVELIALPIPDNVTRIDLKVVSVDCTSSNFDFIMLDKNDITQLNTVHEVLKYTGESLQFADNNFSNYIIVNRDSVETNRLYVYINNHSSSHTGPITIRLVYIAMSTGETMIEGYTDC
jgi:hypothetical protein